MQFVVPVEAHNDLVIAAYEHRGFSREEAEQGARFCELAAWHGIKTHNAIKALHLDELFGSKAGGCVPNAEIEVLDSPYKAAERWNANKKLGQAVAFDAMQRCMELADEYGVGVVSVDNAFHYLWGGGYVIDAAKKGYVAYTNCTAALAEVVPFMGKYPTLGTNPHSWGFPTTEAIGYPICVDWATSTVAMGRVQQFVREGKQLPPGAGVNKDGQEVTDPNEVVALLPFGAHKGYGLSLINELYGAFIGGSLPTLRNRWSEGDPNEKKTANFYFQCVKADAMGVDFANNLSQSDNVKRVIEDVLGHGNENCLLPGQIEAQAAAESEKVGGLLFTEAEIKEFQHVAEEVGCDFDVSQFKTID